MKTDNKYKYIFLTVTMLISSALIVSNTFNIGKRNNEKIYIIGTIILMFCIFLYYLVEFFIVVELLLNFQLNCFFYYGGRVCRYC